MKHVTYGEKAHFLDDDAAMTLIAYASALGNAAASDTVTVSAVDDHGNSVDATFLLNPSSVLLVESSTSSIAEPENREIIEYMRGRMDLMANPPSVEPEELRSSPDIDAYTTSPD